MNRCPNPMASAIPLFKACSAVSCVKPPARMSGPANEGLKLFPIEAGASRLVTAALPGFLYRENSSIINLGSTVALAPNVPFGVYGATKAYVLALSESLQAEFPPEQIYIQVVLPGATRTQIWERSGRDVNALKEAMEVDELVDAAMVGFDRREAVTIPSLGDEKLWDAFVASRKSMLPSLMQVHAADRYRSFGS